MHHCYVSCSLSLLWVSCLISSQHYILSPLQDSQILYSQHHYQCHLLSGRPISSQDHHLLLMQHCYRFCHRSCSGAKRPSLNTLTLFFLFYFNYFISSYSLPQSTPLTLLYFLRMLSQHCHLLVTTLSYIHTLAFCLAYSIARIVQHCAVNLQLPFSQHGHLLFSIPPNFATSLRLRHLAVMSASLSIYSPGLLPCVCLVGSVSNQQFPEAFAGPPHHWACALGRKNAASKSYHLNVAAVLLGLKDH